MQEAYRDLKRIVWVTRVSGKLKKGEPVVRCGTAFAVKSDGQLITCAHIFHGLTVDTIEARQLDVGVFTDKVEIQVLNTNWDLCLLKVKDIVGACQTANLASNGSLREGETLLSITNPHEFVGSFGVSRAMFPCVENVLFADPTSRGHSCSRYSNSIDETPNYRIMGHIWNRTNLAMSVNAGLIPKDNYYGKLHPLIPIIQCGDICTGEGCAGGPVFNTRREVVGIIVSNNFTNHQVAIHVTLIREFVKEECIHDQD